MKASNLKLWQLISPALPVGAFQYSQGLEQAVANNWVHDRQSALRWIKGLLRCSIQCVDLPLLSLAFAAWKKRDEDELLRLNDLCLACRETSELREEERNMGFALGQLLKDLGEPLPDARLGFVITFAIAAINQNIPLLEASQGFAWSWCENQVLNTVKLIPLGHTQGQKMLRNLQELLPVVVQEAQQISEQDIGLSAYGLAIASSQHEQLSARLYRS